MNWLKNKNIFFVLFFFLSAVLAFYVNDITYIKTVKKLSEFVFWMSVPAFLFSLVTLFVKEEVAGVWRRFSNYFLLTSVVIILLTPNSSHGMDVYPFIKENVTIVLAALYSVVSLLLILYKSFKKS